MTRVMRAMCMIRINGFELSKVRREHSYYFAKFFKRQHHQATGPPSYDLCFCKTKGRGVTKEKSSPTN